MASDASLAPSSLRLLIDLQQVSQIAQTFSGCLEPETIAKQVTDQLVKLFGCSLARIWLVEPDQTMLRLVASSGLYTHTNGSFAKVPMGAFKVGKIAQNRIPFLSNHLAEETWVKDRAWAIAQQITGFAGYPLAVGDRVLGVLAVFSCRPLSPEFLEVLQCLCTTVTVALDSALAHQQAAQTPALSHPLYSLPLSEQLAMLLPQSQFVLVGTERSLAISQHCLFLRAGEILNRLFCNHCRLMYETTEVLLEAMVILHLSSEQTLQEWMAINLDELRVAATCLAGRMQIVTGENQTMIQIVVALPYESKATDTSPLSDREQEILSLLGQGLRDRDIADRLHISERTVKFHVNNAVTKLQAQTRCQALYQATVRGWLEPRQ